MKILRGIPASPGKISGKAVVVKSSKDFKKVKKGMILVTTATTPAFTPILSKVIGIVTDYGGVCSHAAMISREFGIPCVVGTEKATKKIKDFMKITVDGSKGVVEYDE